MVRGSNSVEARFSATFQTGPGAQPASCTMGKTSFPGVTPHLHLVPWSRMCRSIPLLPLWAVRPVQSLSTCTVELYLYSPYVPYGLFRASVPVQYSYNSTPPMSRTACTDPHCLYSTAKPLLLSVPVQYSYTSTPLCTCTVQLYLYSTQYL